MMQKKDENFSDSSSNHSNPEILISRKEKDQSSQFFNENALIINHYGPRILMVSSPFPQKSSYRYPKTSYNKSQDLYRPSSSQKAGFSRTSPLNHSKLIDPKSAKLRISRRVERRSNISKFNFTPEEQMTYEDFAKLLSAFEPEDMCELLAEALKDAKNMMFK